METEEGVGQLIENPELLRQLVDSMPNQSKESDEKKTKDDVPK